MEIGKVFFFAKPHHQPHFAGGWNSIFKGEKSKKKKKFAKKTLRAAETISIKIKNSTLGSPPLKTEILLPNIWKYLLCRFPTPNACNRWGLWQAAADVRSNFEGFFTIIFLHFSFPRSSQCVSKLTQNHSLWNLLKFSSMQQYVDVDVNPFTPFSCHPLRFSTHFWDSNTTSKCIPRTRPSSAKLNPCHNILDNTQWEGDKKGFLLEQQTTKRINFRRLSPFTISSLSSSSWANKFLPPGFLEFLKCHIA